MDRASALQLLPAVHAAAVVLDEEGVRHDAIAVRLGVDPAVVPTLVEIARRKLAALQMVGDPAR